MRYLARITCVIFILITYLTPSLASDREHQNVTSFLKKIFDQPQNPLSVDAVAVSGNYSLASWTQRTKGGRALLKKTGDKWEIVMCGGKDLKQASALKKAGIPARDVDSLLKQLTDEEGKAPQHRRLSFDSFTSDGQGNRHDQN